MAYPVTFLRQDTNIYIEGHLEDNRNIKKTTRINRISSCSVIYNNCIFDTLGSKSFEICVTFSNYVDRHFYLIGNIIGREVDDYIIYIHNSIGTHHPISDDDIQKNFSLKITGNKVSVLNINTIRRIEVTYVFYMGLSYFGYLRATSCGISKLFI